MLILNRKVGERVIADGEIEIVVLESKGSRVKLGINAPAHYAILRRESSRIDDASDHKIPVAV